MLDRVFVLTYILAACLLLPVIIGFQPPATPQAAPPAFASLDELRQPMSPTRDELRPATPSAVQGEACVPDARQERAPTDALPCERDAG